MKNPGIFFRFFIASAQFAFVNAYFIAYMIAPKTCHRFVGYLEEEAVHTYTMVLKAMDEDKLPHWSNKKAPIEAVEYYELNPETASMRDVILSIRADEACHRSVNHHFSDIPSYYSAHCDEIQMSTKKIKDLDVEEIK